MGNRGREEKEVGEERVIEKEKWRRVNREEKGEGAERGKGREGER